MDCLLREGRSFAVVVGAAVVDGRVDCRREQMAGAFAGVGKVGGRRRR